MAHTRTIAQFIALQAQIDTSATGGKNPLLELADSLGLRQPDDDGSKDADWTPDQEPPAMARARRDDAPDFAAFAATFGGPAAGGKGIVLEDAVIEPAKPKEYKYGFHLDGSPRDAMESEADCVAGYCSVCRDVRAGR